MSVDLKHDTGRNERKTVRSKEQSIAKILIFNSRNLNYKMQAPDSQVQTKPETNPSNQQTGKRDPQSDPFSFQNVLGLVHPETKPPIKKLESSTEKFQVIPKESTRQFEAKPELMTQNDFQGKLSGITNNLLSGMANAERPSLNLYKPGNQSRTSLRQAPRVSLDDQKPTGLETVELSIDKPKNSIKAKNDVPQQKVDPQSFARQSKTSQLSANPVTMEQTTSHQMKKPSFEVEEISSPGFTQINVPLKTLLESKSSLADKKLESNRPNITAPVPVTIKDYPSNEIAMKNSTVDFPGNVNKLTFADAKTPDDLYQDSEKHILIVQPVKVFGQSPKIIHDNENLSMKSQESRRNNEEHHYVTFQKPKERKRHSPNNSQKPKANYSPGPKNHTTVKTMAYPPRQTSPANFHQTGGGPTRHLMTTSPHSPKPQINLTVKIPDFKDQMNEMINQRFPLIDMRYRPLRRSLSLPRFSSPLIDKNPSFYIDKVRKLEAPVQTGKFTPKPQGRRGGPAFDPSPNRERRKYTNPFKND
jgi:hypothetical protein